MKATPAQSEVERAAPRKIVNCWEFNGCGREAGGARANDLGVCPAAVDDTFAGINRGTNAGRICWAVAGTFCDGEVQGTFAEKRGSCTRCEFFRLVQAEERAPDAHCKFLRFISEEDRSPIFDHMPYRHVKAGERFISQGDVEEVAYVIQRGSCLVIVEKDGELHPTDHYGEGDIVGGLGILTGEPRLAHVEAETDMELWVLEKVHFDHSSERDPALRDFLTEVVANRFDSKRPMGYRTVGKYVATDIIGRGGYSIVYKGLHVGLNMPIAIKMMRHNLAMDPDFLSSFHREAKTIASLRHDNIVRVLDIEERYRTVFIVMELVEGEGLNDMIKRVRLIPPSQAVNFITQICSGLDYAHKRGIVHRDINSDNIVILPGDHVKILDFGLACAMGTEEMNMSGTIAYMAPEQIRGDAVDQRTDIYALGITAYEMLTGDRPFPDDDLPALVTMHLSQDVPDPRERVPELPEALSNFVLKACRCDANERYQDIGEILRDLQPLADTHGARSLHPFQEKQKMTSLLLIYDQGCQLELGRLIDDFASKARAMGAVLKMSETHDV